MSLPKVSAVMPTYNRGKYVPMSIRCFLQQTYQNKELIIIDDGTEPIEVPIDERIHHIHLCSRTTTGAKRNLGASRAQGSFVANWDDDDFSASYRLEDQVRRLSETGKAVTGYNTTVVYDEATGLFYKNLGGVPYFASGTSQCYTKSWWARHQFPDCSYGEDSFFSRVARLNDQLAVTDANKTMVARKHANNTDYVHLQKLRKLTTNDISVEFFTTLNNKFELAPAEEARAQFRSTLIGENYKVSELPEISTR